ATCIGYGSDSINGSGSGRELNEKILQSAKEIVDLAKDDPEIFQLLPLLEEGIGADIVSDMTQTIIDDEICQFTVEAMEKLGIKGTYQQDKYILPWNPYSNCPVKLLPEDTLSNLPMADNFDEWVTKVAAENRELRNGINEHIGETWFECNKAQKKEAILELIKNDKDFFFAVLKTLQDTNLDHYDIEKDYQGLRRWLEDSKKFITPKTFNKIKSVDEKQEALFEAAEEIILHFKDIVENQDLWRIFWTEHGSDLKHVNELYSQMLFYMVSNTWLMAQDSNVSVDRFFNQETKQIHYIFSVSKKCSVIVQVKHSDNFAGLEKGYDKQHSLYNEGKAKRSFYVVVNFGDKKSNQLQHILEKQGDDCRIVEIHACAEEKQQSLFDFDFNIDWFDGLESPESIYTAEKRKGGKKRHERTEVIKDKIIKPLFKKREVIKGRSTKQRAANLNIKLSSLQEMNDNQLSEFSKIYGLDIEILKDSIDYFSDDKEEQVYKWCLAIEKETT
ncbi:MAG: hypothetical protein ABL867_05510, partial [Rickettsiales bacterium]